MIDLGKLQPLTDINEVNEENIQKCKKEKENKKVKQKSKKNKERKLKPEEIELIDSYRNKQGEIEFLGDSLFEDQKFRNEEGQITTDQGIIEENKAIIDERKRHLILTKLPIDSWANDYKNKQPSVTLQDKEEQAEVASNILKVLEEKDNVILEAPTGWGKTGLAYQIWKQSGKRVLILNHSNVLLNQYIDLLEMNMKNECISLMGKSNYHCYRNSDKKVSESTCTGNCVWKKSPTCYCEYYYRKERARNDSLVISNYHQQLLSDPGSYDIIVCDECHNIEKIMVDYSTVKMSKSIINEIKDEFEKLKNKYKKDEAEINALIFNMERLLLNVKEENYKEVFKHFYTNIDRINSIYKTEDKELTKEYLDPYQRYVSNIEENEKLYSNYIFEANDETLTYKLVPLFINRDFSRKVRAITDKLVLMSATVINHENMIKDLGLNPEKTEYIELESKVKKENRPIVPIPICKISMRNQDFDKSPEFIQLCNKIVDILKLHEVEEESGFIYCNSYNLAKIIYKGIVGRTSYHILMNSSREETKEVLNQFLDTTQKKRLLISCSFAEGVNFNDDISRFQIIPKVPYLYLGSKRIKLKTNLNNRWYVNKAIEQIIQVAGRSVRSPNDNAITYILDSAFPMAYNRYKIDYPSWFDEAIIWSNER